MANTPPLWKQLLGAVSGAAIAVAIYTGYKSVEPLGAYLLPPGYHSSSSAAAGTGVRLNTTEVVERETRLNARAMEVASRFSAYRAGKSVMAVAPMHMAHSSSSEAMMAMEASSEKHKLPPAPAGAWLDQEWSSEPMWSTSSSVQSTMWIADASAHATTAKYASPEALPSSGAAGMLAVVAGIGGVLGVATLRVRTATLRA